MDFDQLTGLKFPEDYPGARVDTLDIGTRKIRQNSAPTSDARDPTVPLRVVMRGLPSITALNRFYVGVRVRPRSEGIRRRPGRPAARCGSTTSGSTTRKNRWGWPRAYSFNGEVLRCLRL